MSSLQVQRALLMGANSLNLLSLIVLRAGETINFCSMHASGGRNCRHHTERSERRVGVREALHC